MELSERYKQTVDDGFGFLWGIVPSLLIIFGEIHWVLSQERFSIDDDFVAFIIMGGLIIELLLLFLATGFVLSFVISCVQQVLHAKWEEAPPSFSLNMLSYRLFYAQASRLNVLVFGFLMGLVFQGMHLLNSVHHASDWHTLAWFFGGMVQGFILQFFVQSLLITLHYISTHLLFSPLHPRIQPKKVKKYARKLRSQAVLPENLILSFVGTPFVVFSVLQLTKLFGATHTFQEIIFQMALFSVLMYVEVTLLLFGFDLHKTKKKTKA